MTAAAMIGAVISARMDSRRLPGKALAPVRGRPLLWYVASRIPRSLLDVPPVLATSDREIDTPLAEEGAALGLTVFRGSAEDVAGRVLAAGRTYGMEGIFRINGDSPFVEASLLERAAAIYRVERPDLVTNLLPRSFPYGVSVELFDPAALAACLARRDSARLREHVTACFYDDPASFDIRNILAEDGKGDPARTRVRLTVDDPADLSAFRNFVESTQDEWPKVCYRTALESGRFGTI